MIQFKGTSHEIPMLGELRRGSIGLRCVVHEVEVEAERLGYTMRCTSVQRETGGVHNSDPPRAADFTFVRLPDRVQEYPPKEIGPYLKDWVNERFVYGKNADGTKDLNCALWHDAGTGKHLHIQVPTHPLIVTTSIGGLP